MFRKTARRKRPRIETLVAKHGCINQMGTRFTLPAKPPSSRSNFDQHSTHKIADCMLNGATVNYRDAASKPTSKTVAGDCLHIHNPAPHPRFNPIRSYITGNIRQVDPDRQDCLVILTEFQHPML